MAGGSLSAPCSPSNSNAKKTSPSAKWAEHFIHAAAAAASELMSSQTGHNSIHSLNETSATSSPHFNLGFLVSLQRYFQFQQHINLYQQRVRDCSSTLPIGIFSCCCVCCVSTKTTRHFHNNSTQYGLVGYLERHSFRWQHPVEDYVRRSAQEGSGALSAACPSSCMCVYWC